MQKTALFDVHEELNGRIVDFAGWALPVQYASVIQEHKAVRENAGLFDCSHMGQFFVNGPDAYRFLNKVISNNLDKIEAGRGLYSGLLYDNGCFVDDIIVYMIDQNSFFIVVNACNIDKDLAWLKEKLAEFKMDLTIQDRSSEFSLLALQGPKAPAFCEELFPGVYDSLKRFGHTHVTFQNAEAYICRTGYTGEAGVEIIIKNEAAPKLFRQIIQAGVEPCGLASRDSLRLEKGFSLYGHEITDKINALEAGLGWICDLSKDDFIGKEALLKHKEAGINRKLVGFHAKTRPIPREGDIFINADGEEIGFICSGTVSPILGHGIGIGYLPINFQEGDEVTVQTKRKSMSVTLCSRNFV